MNRLALFVSPFLILLALAFVACNDASGGGSTATPADTPAATETVPPSDAPSDELDATQVVELLRPSVVHILSEVATLDVFGQVTPQEGVGTGFIIDSDNGYIVTNNHVITADSEQPAERITVTLNDGRQFPATVIGRDAPTDLAVLQVDAEDLPAVTLGSSDALKVGQQVLAIGNALNLPGGPTVTTGVVSAKGRLIQSNAITIPDAIQTDASINPGNSGGPLANMRGEVVGITTAVIRGEAEGIGLAIAIDSAKPIVDELIANGQIDRGFLGVRIVEITPSLADSFDLAVDHGIGLEEVTAGGPADEGGLQPGDVIVSIAGDEINNSGDLFRALTDHRAGETVEIEYYRGSDVNTTDVTLG